MADDEVVVGDGPTAVDEEPIAIDAVSTGTPSPEDAVSAQPAGVWRRLRAAGAIAVSVLAFLLVWFALISPNQLSRITPGVFVRIPLEGLVIVVLGLALPGRWRWAMAVPAGILLGLLSIVKIIDFGFYAALDRPFNAVFDMSYFGPAVGVLRDSVGAFGADVAVVVAVLLLLGFLALMPLSILRLTNLAARYRGTTIRTVAVLGVVWVLCAAFGVQIIKGSPIASSGAYTLTYDRYRQTRVDLTDHLAFAKTAGVDAYRETPGADLLTGLRGKDVIVAFVESYGRVAVQDSAFSPGVDAVLAAGTDRLRAAGFDARSAFLTSPTFGGISWLAHSTLQSGLWVDNQQRYNTLVKSDRFTLSDAFKRAGWRVVGDIPSNHQNWREGRSFYHYDTIYDARNVGYNGPGFSYASMPDQYILAAFQRLELATPGHAPVMAEIDLVSSHTPWAPLPRFVDWSQVGDGSVFNGMPQQGQSPSWLWQNPDDVRTAYGQSVQYSMNTLVSFVQTYADPNLVLVVLGDHQPATIVTGSDASRDVPITIISHDPAVLDRISGWGWQAGILPGPDAPVWRMDAFRDKFLAAYGAPAS